MFTLCKEPCLFSSWNVFSINASFSHIIAAISDAQNVCPNLRVEVRGIPREILCMLSNMLSNVNLPRHESPMTGNPPGARNRNTEIMRNFSPRGEEYKKEAWHFLTRLQRLSKECPFILEQHSQMDVSIGLHREGRQSWGFGGTLTEESKGLWKDKPTTRGLVGVQQRSYCVMH